MYLLPVLITDSGSPALSSTNTLPVRVCDCDSDGVALSCGAVAYTATGLSTGALLAILSCIITLLGKTLLPSEQVIRPGSPHLQTCSPVLYSWGSGTFQGTFCCRCRSPQRNRLPDEVCDANSSSSCCSQPPYVNRGSGTGVQQSFSVAVAFKEVLLWRFCILNVKKLERCLER